MPRIARAIWHLRCVECFQELRTDMEAAASAASDREDQLRGEIRRAENRMQAAELAASEASSHSGDSTKPLLRQIEAMAAASVRPSGAVIPAQTNAQATVDVLPAESLGKPAGLCPCSSVLTHQ
jgi:hypothetical protein